MSEQYCTGVVLGKNNKPANLFGEVKYFLTVQYLNENKRLKTKKIRVTQQIWNTVKKGNTVTLLRR